MRPYEATMYNTIASIQNTQAQINWNRFQAYLFFHVIAVPALFSAKEPDVKFIISLSGIWIAAVIPLTILRGRQWIRFYFTKLSELESLDPEGDDAVRVKVVSDPRFKKIADRTVFSPRNLIIPIAIGFLLFWVEETVRHGAAVIPKSLTEKFLSPKNPL